MYGMTYPDVTEGTLRRSGSEVHYWLAGPRDGPLVAFTPGATMDHRMFDAQVEAATEAGYRTLTWDVRGHGRSKPIGDGEFTVGTCAEDLAALISAAGHEKAVLVGQSFGGYISQELYLRYPARISALVIVDSTDIKIPPNQQERLILRLTRAFFRVLPDGARRKLTAKNVATKPEVQRYAHEATSLLSKKEFLTVWRAVTKVFRDEPDHRIRVPLLITHGEYDRAGTIAKEAPNWAAREPDCRYRVVPDAGHNANQDNPDYFNRVLLEFLRENAPIRR